MWHSVNWHKLVLLLTPTFIRKSAETAFNKVVISPIESIYNEWFNMRRNNLYKLAHTGQVCYLRKALNDKFDPSDRRIYIGNGNTFERQYIYTNGEQHSRYLGVITLYQRDDYADTGVDFIVFVPTAISQSLPYEIRALIDFYKEGVKRYKIEEI